MTATAAAHFARVPRERGDPDRAGTSLVWALFTAKKAPQLLVSVIVLFYALAPLLIYFFVIDERAYLQMAGLATLTAACIALGNGLNVLDRWTRGTSHRVIIGSHAFIRFFFVFFLLFAFVTLFSAPSVPLLSAFTGADASALSDERGEFLKGREGPWIALAYLSSLLTSTFVPYCIVAAYATRDRLRHVFLALLFIYSVSFLVKALFLNLILPLIAFAVERQVLRPRQLIVVGSATATVLLLMIALSGYGSLDASGFQSLADFFSTAYVPGSTLDFLIYRSLAIPVFSVVDTLLVHANELRGELLWGTTSSLIAGLAGVERINIERMVASYQYGGWNEFANSNVVFFADGYINFGIVGVVCYGLFVGLTFRILRRSPDIGVRSLAVLYAFLLYSSPLIGMLFSNGFAFFFLHALFVRLGSGRKSLPAR